MLKKYLIVSFVFVVVFTAMFFTACDSLWTVEEKSSLSFNVDFNQLIDDTNGNILFSLNEDVLKSTDSQNDVPSLNVVVSLYNSETQERIRTQTVTVTEKDYSVKVQFLDLEPNTTVYAEIVFNDTSDNNEIFSARSNSLLLKAGPDNILKTFAKTIYLNKSIGSDENNGYLKDSPVKTLDTALKLLGGANNLIEGATITIIDDDLSPNEELFDTSDYRSLTAELFRIDDEALGENLKIEDWQLVYANKDMLYVKATYSISLFAYTSCQSSILRFSPKASSSIRKSSAVREG